MAKEKPAHGSGRTNLGVALRSYTAWPQFFRPRKAEGRRQERGLSVVEIGLKVGKMTGINGRQGGVCRCR